MSTSTKIKSELFVFYNTDYTGFFPTVKRKGIKKPRNWSCGGAESTVPGSKAGKKYNTDAVYLGSKKTENEMIEYLKKLYSMYRDAPVLFPAIVDNGG